MKRLFVLASAIVLVGSLGCGGDGAVDRGAAAPTVTPEQTTEEIGAAVESGEIDPASYGKQ